MLELVTRALGFPTDLPWLDIQVALTDREKLLSVANSF